MVFGTSPLTMLFCTDDRIDRLLAILLLPATLWIEIFSSEFCLFLGSQNLTEANCVKRVIYSQGVRHQCFVESKKYFPVFLSNSEANASRVIWIYWRHASSLLVMVSHE